MRPRPFGLARPSFVCTLSFPTFFAHAGRPWVIGVLWAAGTLGPWQAAQASDAAPSPFAASAAGARDTKSEGQRPSRVDHRSPEVTATRRNERVPARRGRLPAPSQLNLSEVARTSIRLNWMDNATSEFGIAVERGTPVPDRGGINYGFERVFNVEERVMDRVRSTGWRTDLDDQLLPGTEYCYRVRAYQGTAERDHSAYSPVACARTDP